MKRIIHIIFAIALVAGMTGCASPYMINRSRDAADIFTITVGTGAGASARVGPIGVAPLCIYSDSTGIRGGHFIALNPVNPLEYKMDSGSGGFLIGYGDVFFAYTPKQEHTISYQEYEIMMARGKAYVSGPPKCLGDVIPWPPFISIPSRPTYKSADGNRPKYYYTQIEAVVALGLGIRLGFNPGELLDFLLGWSTIDIYKDDVEEKKTEKPNQI